MAAGACIALSLVVWLVCGALRRRGGRHVRYRRRAKRVVEEMHRRRMAGGAVIGYLRKVNPYVFEEIVLDGFERYGVKVFRNRSYSGDGGIDGVVVVDGQTYLVQCKRYVSNIRMEHVAEFVSVCRMRDLKGFFVHTGRTGRQSVRLARESDCVEIISGAKLLQLLGFRSDPEHAAVENRRNNRKTYTQHA